MKTPAPIAPVGSGSLTERTIDALLEAIFEDRFPDLKLPNEPELAEMLNISRTTVRSALQSLERLGVISRSPGRGTVVIPHVGRNSIALQRLIGFRTLLGERYGKVHVEQDVRLSDEPSDMAVAALGASESALFVKTSKQYLADGEPALDVRDEIPLSHFAQEDQSRLIDGDVSGLQDSIFTLSKAWPGREITHTVVQLGAGTAPNDDAFPLDLAPGTAYLALGETHYASTGEAVAYSAVRIDSRYLTLQVVRHL